MRSRMFQGLLVLGTTAIMAACGGSSSSNSNDGATAAPGEVNVNFTIQDTSTNFALLADPDSFSATIDGCLSGYSKAVDQTNKDDVKVQNTDVGCVFKVTSMAIGAETFDLSAVSTWAQDSSFQITGSSSTTLFFKVISQLDNTISGDQTVSIVYASSAQGTAINDAGANVNTGISIASANDVNLKVTDLTITVDGTTGAGLFDFKLECIEGASGSGAAATCSGTNMSSMVAGIAREDTLTSALTLAECKGVADTNSVTFAAGNIYDAGSDAGAPNGGINTGNLTGPAKLYDAANQKLILAVRGGGADDGCKYYRITIKTP